MFTETAVFSLFRLPSNGSVRLYAATRLGKYRGVVAQLQGEEDEIDVSEALILLHV
jgi:hypothetical protein